MSYRKLLIRKTRKMINVGLERGNDERRLNGRLFYFVIKLVFYKRFHLIFMQFHCRNTRFIYVLKLEVVLQ